MEHVEAPVGSGRVSSWPRRLAGGSRGDRAPRAARIVALILSALVGGGVALGDADLRAVQRASLMAPSARLTTPARPAPGAPAPNGLSESDWTSIRGAYERHRHQVVADAAQPGRWHARNPGQQWQTRFDGRGVVVEPDTGGWTWGLALARYGVAGEERDVPASPVARVRGADNRVSYTRDEHVEEWFVNERQGLEHGFTVWSRPDGGPGPLAFELSVKGDLSPRVEPSAEAVTFVDDRDAAVLTYGALRVSDADGRMIAARFEPADHAVRLVVDAEGARYPLTIDPLAQQAYLKASNTDPNDRFGYSVAIAGDTVIVGAPFEASAATVVNGDQANNRATWSGAAYVFTRTGGVWTQQAYLKASNTTRNLQFGYSVAIAGDTVVVGAVGDGSGFVNHFEPGEGAAYVFMRTGGVWTQQAYLKSPEPNPTQQFGFSVAIADDTVVVGAGAAYVFTRSGGVWTQQAVLRPSTPGGVYVDSVAISGDTVVAGTSAEASAATGINGDQTNDSAPGAGAAWVFTRSGGVWTQQAYLKASNTNAGDLFGWSVAIAGDTVVVGAFSEDSNATGVNGDQTDNSAFSAGAAYVFTRTEGVWTQQAYLKASHTANFANFGSSVAASGDTVVVGAPNSGDADVFTRTGNMWSQQAYLKGSNAPLAFDFGRSVAVAGDTVVVGAYGEMSAATGVNGDQTANNAFFDAGAAYVFTVTTPPTIVPSPPLTRQQGSPAQVVPIASVSDLKQPAATLVVIPSLLTGSGVSITGVSVDADGTVSAAVGATCTASPSTFNLHVTNNSGASADAKLGVIVTGNTAPVQGTYAAAMVAQGWGAVVTPSAAPSDNGSVNTIAASADGFTGTLSVGLDGVVTIGNAGPPGTYTVVVTATDNCGTSSISSFALTVTAAANTLTVHKTLDSGSAALSSFCFTLSPPTAQGQVCADVTTGNAVFTNVPVGTYSAVETAVPGYHQVSNSCAGVQIVNPRDSLTCQVHNASNGGDATTSTVVAMPTSVPADGVSTSTITVTVKGSANVPLAGKTVTLAAGSGASVITTVSGTTNASGQATFTVKDVAVQAVTYTATDVTDGVTVTQTASVSFTALGPSALFVKSDTSTQGNWKGVYGNQGAAIVNDSVNYPAYAQVTPSTKVAYTWVAATKDERALQRADTGRIAACWCADTTFDIDVNLIDGAAHQVALYALDWDNRRTEMVEILVAGTSTVLDTRTLTNFSGGQYLVWTLSGHVTIRVTLTDGSNAVVSGLFFGNPPGPNGPTAVTGTATGMTLTGATLNGTVNPNGVATTAFFQYGLTTSYGSTAGATNVGAGMAVVPMTTPITGLTCGTTYHVRVVGQSSAGTSFGSDVMFNTATCPGGPTAVFVLNDPTTTGNWKGVYGSQGAAIVDDSLNSPPYAQVAVSTNVTWTWVSATTDGRALQRAATERIASCWCASTVDIDVNITDGQPHQVALYALDWDNRGRAERVDVLAFGMGTVLDTRTLTNFSGGQYLVWTLSGHVTIRVTLVAGANAVVSGLFFDSGSTPGPIELTGDATHVSATLDGTVHPNGSRTNVTFQ